MLQSKTSYKDDTLYSVYYTNSRLNKDILEVINYQECEKLTDYPKVDLSLKKSGKSITADNLKIILITPSDSMQIPVVNNSFQLDDTIDLCEVNQINIMYEGELFPFNQHKFLYSYKSFIRHILVEQFQIEITKLRTTVNSTNTRMDLKYMYKTLTTYNN